MNASSPLLAFFSVSTAAIAATAAAPDRGMTAQARADLQSSEETGETKANLRNQTFDFLRIPMGGDPPVWTNVLVHRQQDLVMNLPLEGFQKKELSVEVLAVEGAKRTPLFRFKEKASDSRIDANLGILIASDFGCCDTTDAHAVYSLQNGKRLLFAGGDRDPYVFHAIWPNTPRSRIVGVHVSGSERDAEIYRGQTKNQGPRSLLISLASKTEVLDRLVLNVDVGGLQPAVAAIDWVASEKMHVRLRDISVWPPEAGKAAPVPTLKITLATGQTILIPIDTDRLGKIHGPKSITSTRLSVAK